VQQMFIKYYVVVRIFRK